MANRIDLLFPLLVQLHHTAAQDALLQGVECTYVGCVCHTWLIWIYKNHSANIPRGKKWTIHRDEVQQKRFPGTVLIWLCAWTVSFRHCFHWNGVRHCSWKERGLQQNSLQTSVGFPFLFLLLITFNQGLFLKSTQTDNYRCWLNSGSVSKHASQSCCLHWRMFSSSLSLPPPPICYLTFADGFFSSITQNFFFSYSNPLIS